MSKIFLKASCLLALPIVLVSNVYGDSTVGPAGLIQPEKQNITVPVETTKEGKSLITVIAEGVGSDVESASKNAAENALMQVVGSFIDAQKQIDKRTEIVNGLRNETKNLTSSTKEYSQGTIKSFNVIDAKQDGVLTRVNAQVVVRIDDFHAYIKKLAEGEVAVSDGLFVKMATEKKQSQDLSSIMANIIKPIESGEVIDFLVSDPKPLEDLEGNYCNAGCLSQIKKKVGGGNVVQFEVKASLRDGFKKNILNTLDSIATEKKQYYFDHGTFFETSAQPLRSIQETDDVSILVNLDGEKFSLNRGDAASAIIFDAYRMKAIKDDFSKKINIDPNTPFSVKPSTTLNIDVLDSENSVLQHESIGGITKNKALVLPAIIDDYSFNSIVVGNQEQSWSNDFRLYELNMMNCFIYAVKKFKVVMSINDDALSKAKKIKLYLKQM